jgi:hypothetical protein
MIPVSKVRTCSCRNRSSLATPSSAAPQLSFTVTVALHYSLIALQRKDRTAGLCIFNSAVSVSMVKPVPLAVFHSFEKHLHEGKP